MLGLQDRVHFLGFVDNARECLKAFDIFILTSRTEGLPYVLLEAGIAELPVIATEVGGIPEVLPSSLIKLTNPDTESLIEAIEQSILQKSRYSSQKGEWKLNDYESL